MVDYETIRKRNRKTASITVCPQNLVTVIVPEQLSDDEVEAVIKKKRTWILSKQAFNREVKYPSKPKEYVNGESFTYLGRNYRLKLIRDGNAEVILKGGQFQMHIQRGSTEDDMRALLEAWYKEHALTRVKKRAEKFASFLGLEPKALKIGQYKRQWGSCHQDGTVIINWKVIMAPISIVDYVVVHELCHLKYHDHSSAFWRMLGKVLPEYQEHKEWLRVNGAMLEL